MPSSGDHRLERRTYSITSLPSVRARNLQFCPNFGEVLQQLQGPPAGVAAFEPSGFSWEATGSAGLKQCYQVTLKIIPLTKSQVSCLAVPFPVPGSFYYSHNKNTFCSIPVCFSMELLFHSRRWKRRILLPLCSVLSWWELEQFQAAAQPFAPGPWRCHLLLC